MSAPRGVITRFTWASLLANRARSLVSVVGVALSCALICAVFTSVTSLDRSLLEMTVRTEGAWQLWMPAAPATMLDAVTAEPDVASAAVSYELGSALTSRGMLTLVTMPQALVGSQGEAERLTVLPEVVYGRLPSAPGEVALNLTYRGATLTPGDDAEPLGGGAESAGEPEFADEPAAATATSNGPIDLGSTLTMDVGFTQSGQGDPYSYSSYGGYFDDEGRRVPVRLTSPHTETYTVVGFFEPQEAWTGDTLASTSSATAVVAREEALDVPRVAARLWIDASNASDQDLTLIKLRAAAGASAAKEASTCVDDTAIVHWGLIRYQGQTGDQPIADSAWLIAGLLTVVVVVAGVSLTSNSFSISVAERTRQLGLLASLGATKRQLRGSIYLEALMLGAVGIPLGLGLGVGGVAFALRYARDAFAVLMERPEGITLHVEPSVLAGVALLSVGVLLVSATVPAVRASRVSPVEAIRQVGAGKPAVRTRTGDLMAGGGTPRLARRLARRNVRRAGSRGRVVVASLAVSLALIVTSGSISTYVLDPLDDIATLRGASGTTDLQVVLGPTDAQEGEHADTAELARVADAVAAAARDAGATRVDSGAVGWASVTVPSAMLSDQLRERFAEQFEAERAGQGLEDGDGRTLDEGEEGEPPYDTRFTKDGDYVGGATLYFPDEATWDRVCERVGADPADTGRAVIVNDLLTWTGDGRVLSLEPLEADGAVTLCAMELPEGYGSLGSLIVGEDGEVSVVAYAKETGDAEVFPLDEAEAVTRAELACSLVDGGVSELFELFDNARSSFPAIVVSPRLMGTSPPYETFSAEVNVSCDDVEAMRETLKKVGLAESSGEAIAVDVYDLNAYGRQSRATARAARLFLNLFSVVMLLIALANVFNTLSNSVALRRKEFAVLSSVGMGPGAFRRMIVRECASYALRGGLWGLALSVPVTWLIWRAVDISFAGIVFGLPWLAIAEAAVAVGLVLVVSVGYAMRKSRQVPIVEALRTDVA